MHQSQRVAAFAWVMVASCCQLAGCSGGPADEPSQAAEEPAPATFAELEDPPTQGSVGPVGYGFDSRRLARAEIELGVPPDYRTEVWATKFIARDRAALLGERACTYGFSGGAATCTARREAGLALALLERPIADYRDAFAQWGVEASFLPAATLDGAAGFNFVSTRDGQRIVYGFFPVGERTLMLARRLPQRGTAADPAIATVIASIRIPGPTRQVTPTAGRKNLSAPHR